MCVLQGHVSALKDINACKELPSRPGLASGDVRNVTYNLWRLGDLTLLVRCGLHGIIKQPKATPTPASAPTSVAFGSAPDPPTASPLSSSSQSSKHQSLAAQTVAAPASSASSQTPTIDRVISFQSKLEFLTDEVNRAVIVSNFCLASLTAVRICAFCCVCSFCCVEL